MDAVEKQKGRAHVHVALRCGTNVSNYIVKCCEIDIVVYIRALVTASVLWFGSVAVCAV